MADIFHFVMSASFYATIVGLVIILIKVALRNRLTAKWHFLIWMVLILKLLIPFGPESAVSLFNAAPEMTRQNMSEIAHQMEKRYEDSLSVGNPQSYMPPAQQQDEAFKAAALTESLLPYAWAAGVVFMLLWLVFTYCSFLRNLRRGSLVKDERISRIFNICKAKMGINKSIDILLVIQDAVSAPSLFGVKSPKILLSPAMLSLSDKELEYILLHELAHYKRKDMLVNYLLLVFQALHWFNPFIWYCFRRIRQDMEIATDEQVLLILKSTEYKDYGRALLAVLEGFAAPKLAPKLLGIVDGKKNIERRLNLIKMADFFKSRRRLSMAVGLPCLVMLGVIMLTNGLTRQDPPSNFAGYNAEALFKYKTAYVGNNSKVVNLISHLRYAELRREVSLQTQSIPYGVTVDYDFSGVNLDTRQIESSLRDNAVVMFALIDNVDMITFKAKEAIQPSIYRYSRAELQKNYDNDLREYSKDISTLETLLKSLGLRLHVYPEKYTLFMSSVPGVRISAEYRGSAVKVRYSTESGALFTWETSSGEVSKGLPSIELPLDTMAYWSPLDSTGQIFVGNKNTVIVTLLDKEGNKINERQVTIIYDGSLYYTVQPAIDIEDGTDTEERRYKIEGSEP